MQHVTAMFHRDCLCEVMLPLQSHLHGSYMMVLLLLLLVGVVLMAMLWHLCVCMCAYNVFTARHTRGGRSWGCSWGGASMPTAISAVFL